MASYADAFVGGHSLSNSSGGRVHDFVKDNGGHTVITKVLIANNGIAAVKEIRSIRQWSYEMFGTERAVEFTVMATPEDLKANAEYIRMAESYVEVPGGSNNNNYANVDLIVDVAERTGVHAVWAGWGHASENPRLPESLTRSKNKIVFIGPPGSAMRSLGDKISSTIVAQSANVPTMPWSGTGVVETEQRDGLVTVPDSAYQAACITTVEDGLRKAEIIGWPVMIKASEGGGGKGIRMVSQPEAFQNAFQAVAGEIPGSPIFVMKLASQARHLEVQLLADQYGNAISLFGRDCSVQRRHQKIIEEAPVTIADPEIFEKMERAAVRLAKLVGYVSAGTVEYLYNHEEKSFYFLELNPRLQVEHPCTEMVSGVNLPAAQLQIAMGIPLHRIRHIRSLYGVNQTTASEIDFDMAHPDTNKSQRKPRPNGHVVAVRITAENPDAGFQPSSGSLHELNFRSSTNVWGYFSVNSTGGLHKFADSQFGHIFAFGQDRSESRKNMIVALKELSIRGDFRTTVEYLVKLLELEAFKENTITTGWLDSLISGKLTAERPDTTTSIICGAVTHVFLASEACWIEYERILEKGQVPSRDVLKTVFGVEFTYDGIRYSFTCSRSSTIFWTLYLNGSRTIVGARRLADGGLLVLLNGKSHSVYWRKEVGAMRLMIDGKTCSIEQENDPTQLRSPSPGKLVRLCVDSGDHVTAGQQYAEIEVMKMLLPLVAAEDGIVQFVKQVGASLEPGDILGILTLDDPSRVKRAIPFEGFLPPLGMPVVYGQKPHQEFARCQEMLNDILDGYDNQSTMSATLKDYIAVLRNPELPYSEIGAILSSLSGRIPQALEQSIRNAMATAQSKSGSRDLPAMKLKRLIDHYASDNLTSQEQVIFKSTTADLYSVLERFSHGLVGHEMDMIAQLLSRHADTEKLFGGSIESKILKLREEYKDDLSKVTALVLSHLKANSKVKLVLALLEHLRRSGLNVSNPESKIHQVLQQLTVLETKSSVPVTLKARELLIYSATPSYEERVGQMERILQASTKSHYGEYGGGSRSLSLETLKELTDSQYSVFDVLPSFFEHKEESVVLAALDVYVRRAYKAYSLLSIEHEESDADEEMPCAVTWRFTVARSAAIPVTPTEKILHQTPNVNDLKYILDRNRTQPMQSGVLASFPSLKSLEQGFAKIARLLPSFDRLDHQKRHGDASEAPNVMNLALRIFDKANDLIDAEWPDAITLLVDSQSELLVKKGVRRVCISVCRPGVYPFYYTLCPNFNNNWREEQALRNIEPALAFQLELSRLSNYDLVPCLGQSQQLHIYHAVARENRLDNRFFMRALVRPGRLRGGVSLVEYVVTETDRLVTGILDALEVVMVQHRNADCNNIFMNFVYNIPVTYEEVMKALSGFIERHGTRLWRLHVTGSEIRIVLEDKDGNTTPIRCMIENVSGFLVNFYGYQEVTTDKGTVILKSLGEKGPMHLQPVDTAYPTKESLQPKRYQAHLIGTTYVYDFVGLFTKALQDCWKKAQLSSPKLVVPKKVLVAKELILDENDELVEVDRPAGNNTFGMVGWVFTMKTPEYPQGRQTVVIANDITFKIGSFGPQEDGFFSLCSQYARKRGLPRIYLSANSGARIGIAEEILDLFSCAWRDPNHPEKGVEYLYLTRQNWLTLQERGAGLVKKKEVMVDGELQYQITDIIGAQHGIGVESLKGSGLIAGETSRAYDDIFTITLVTARSVGIGAYLVRLGQRSVQVEGQPIILTGAPALNKVLGREVYTSNLQLGGTQIMFKNGVSHLTAKSDFDGAAHILTWLSYIPIVKGSPPPIVVSEDPWDRDIGYYPPKTAYDPRWFIEGKDEETGFFDRGSFFETLSGWAQTVVVGRARLGGIPIGVIAVETRTIERIVPADPANPSSFEQRVMEAGQVWYPNSAYKTAQAIFDFDREGLPLIIFANWRGFSGGQQDMYDEILKQGAKIVDGLSNYKQPVFVYVVPNGELRGGAWVVLDPSINPGKMEMYADVEARAGVLEAEGIVEIKIRRDKTTKLMERLDTVCAQLKHDSLDRGKSVDERNAALQALEERQSLLEPSFKQIALLYADLHDRAGRMEAKGCAKPLVWINARRHFYWALRARLAKLELEKQFVALPAGAARLKLQVQLDNHNLGDDNMKLASHYENFDMRQALIDAKADNAVHQLLRTAQEDPKALAQSLIRLGTSIPEDVKMQIISALNQNHKPPSYNNQ